ncbi:MAG: flagellar basal body L-ring protein FlgH [bacterium]|nr:flagellar basal body L-ring protein FlgH [bacterium]MCS7309480.1 flagellar basal body L-ring protein FlgH [Armatimonadota bacterium]
MRAIGIAIVILSLCGGLAADSLWKDGTRSLYADRKAIREGDVLTVLIFESTTASSRADTKTAKSESASTKPGVGPLLSLLPEWSVSGKTGSQASGSTTRSGTLVGKISVVVKEVLPNGNLRVEGTRTIGVNGEKEKIVLTGIVRPEDVSPENTVPSTAIAQAEIHYEGKGPVGNKQREGLLTKLLKWLF